ncbi:hypothetical protein [Thalassotalea marina]|uniref:Uncharacterized protein n=1 Tax=Thalassotalea marina TaxID=1673741 RepID=A0A919EID5_9GAMM|nr:hypothetical protein [Thalassotalea marina]GHF82547.1 hypothetical protein GCM10017161_07160 [Thalassotalea marina]
MSFFKSLILAIIATLIITYALGTSLIELFDIDVYMGDELIEPLKAISISALVVVVLMLVAVAIVLSVFGSIIFIGVLIFGAIIFAMVGAFWPIFLIAGVIWLCTGNKKTVHQG